MECMRNCWFENPDADFDVNYPSDSSVGLAGTDNSSIGLEGGTVDIYKASIYDSGNESGEVSRLEIVNENQVSSHNTYHHQHTCTQCPIYERQIIELRTSLMEQRREDSMTIRGLKKKYNKLVEKYLDKKKLLKTLAMIHLNDTAKLENIKNEMKRLSNNKHEILKDKHNVERIKDELKTTNYNLQLEMNNHHQTIHCLKMKNDRIKTEMFLAEETRRKSKTKLLKKLNDVKQDNLSYINRMSIKSMKNIHENNDKVWVRFDDNMNKIGDGDDIDESDHDESDIHDDNRSDDSDDYNNNNNNNPLNVLRAPSVKELPAIDEQKEDGSIKQKQSPIPTEEPPFYQRQSINSDSSYNYDEDDGAHFVNNSPSKQNINDYVSWKQQKSYKDYTGYNNDGITPKSGHDTFNFIDNYPSFNAATSYTKASSIETPISPLTSIGGHSRYGSLFEVAGGKSTKSIYIDNDGIDVTDDDNNNNNHNNHYQIKIDRLKAEHQQERVSMIKQLNELKVKLNHIEKKHIKQSENDNDKQQILPSLDPNDSSTRSIQSNESEKTVTYNSDKMKDDDVDDDIDDVDDDINDNTLELKRTLSASNVKIYKIYKNKRMSWPNIPLSDNEPIDLKRSQSQRVNEKMHMVSLENTSLKLKNEKLKKEIKELTKQLSSSNDKLNDNKIKKKKSDK